MVKRKILDEIGKFKSLETTLFQGFSCGRGQKVLNPRHAVLESEKGIDTSTIMLNFDYYSTTIFNLIREQLLKPNTPFTQTVKASLSKRQEKEYEK